MKDEQASGKGSLKFTNHGSLTDGRISFVSLTYVGYCRRNGRTEQRFAIKRALVHFTFIFIFTFSFSYICVGHGVLLFFREEGGREEGGRNGWEGGWEEGKGGV